MTLQILISTMFRENLDFLKPMFSKNNLKDFDIIIVNQTTEDKMLSSSFSNVKVINSLERGSPASRNLAIKNAIADVCLMADDDIVYEPNLKQTIINAYKECPNADMISFEAINENGNQYTNYFPEGIHNKKSLKKIFTWVITFKRDAFKENNIFFNHHFGVGSTFKGETEYVFLRNAFDKGLQMQHKGVTIVMHPNISSGVLMGSDNAFAAKTALRQRYLGNLSYLWLLKYTLYMWIDKYIKFNEIPHKFIIGLQAIQQYKKLKASGEIDRIYDN
ncbi:glycosyltransferase family A protein [Gaetbulibacter jejuensis]|uniref:glycosyltransferase family A protein n=1 Tax=Gaetbulibacter jejuensis TaxID=584607 RepID=UPI0030099985